MPNHLINLIAVYNRQLFSITKMFVRISSYPPTFVCILERPWPELLKADDIFEALKGIVMDNLFKELNVIYIQPL